MAIITVRYFAAIREQLGVERETVDDPKVITLSDLVTLLTQRDGLWPFVLSATNVQIIVNHIQVHDTNRLLTTGDEVAFLPPVTGG